MPTLFNYQEPPVPPKFIVSPFPGLALTNILGRGGAALILTFPHRIVFKTPLKYRTQDDWSEETVSQAITSQGQAEWCMENKKAVYAKLAAKPHRNLLKALLVVDEGIFLPRIDSTLEAYTMSWGMGYPEESISTKYRWIMQIAAGAAWLEALGFVHNDIRPGNVLIDRAKNARLADFGVSGVPGQVHVAWVDQYGIGNCIWILFHKRISERDPNIMDIPPIEHGPTSLIERCFRIQFPSLQHLHQDVLAELDPQPSTSSLMAIRISIFTFVVDTLDSITGWIAAQRCRRLYARLRQEHGPDATKLDFADSRREMDIPGYVFPFSTDLL